MRSLTTLEGVLVGAILEVVKSVYGLPGAPRAWWTEVTTFLCYMLGSSIPGWVLPSWCGTTIRATLVSCSFPTSMTLW